MRKCGAMSLASLHSAEGEKENEPPRKSQVLPQGRDEDSDLVSKDPRCESQALQEELGKLGRQVGVARAQRRRRQEQIAQLDLQLGEVHGQMELMEKRHNEVVSGGVSLRKLADGARAEVVDAEASVRAEVVAVEAEVAKLEQSLKDLRGRAESDEEVIASQLANAKASAVQARAAQLESTEAARFAGALPPGADALWDIMARPPLSSALQARKAGLMELQHVHGERILHLERESALESEVWSQEEAMLRHERNAQEMSCQQEQELQSAEQRALLLLSEQKSELQGQADSLLFEVHSAMEELEWVQAAIRSGEDGSAKLHDLACVEEAMARQLRQKCMSCQESEEREEALAMARARLGALEAAMNSATMQTEGSRHGQGSTSSQGSMPEDGFMLQEAAAIVQSAIAHIGQSARGGYYQPTTSDVGSLSLTAYAAARALRQELETLQVRVLAARRRGGVPYKLELERGVSASALTSSLQELLPQVCHGFEEAVEEES
mmetsp:Transcript_59829/g.110778  ORF Transcript_59829/g.110778 Transcript_59829/m.110778 type:complete len:496 (-) Transcript_59829:119-1606(-)